MSNDTFNLEHANDIHDAAYNAGIVEGEAAARSYIPTVIVSIVGGCAHVEWADGPVNVVIADYDNEDADMQDPDGEPVALWEDAPTLNPERVRQFLACIDKETK